MKKKQIKPKEEKKEETANTDEPAKEEKKEVLTKEDFMKALRKATRPLTRVLPSKGKKKTSE